VRAHPWSADRCLAGRRSLSTERDRADQRAGSDRGEGRHSGKHGDDESNGDGDIDPWSIPSFVEVMRLFMLNLVRGSTHLYTGQEAVAVGACSALREGDLKGGFVVEAKT